MCRGGRQGMGGHSAPSQAGSRLKYRHLCSSIGVSLRALTATADSALPVGDKTGATGKASLAVANDFRRPDSRKLWRSGAILVGGQPPQLVVEVRCAMHEGPVTRGSRPRRAPASAEARARRPPTAARLPSSTRHIAAARVRRAHAIRPATPPRAQSSDAQPVGLARLRRSLEAVEKVVTGPSWLECLAGWKR